MQVLSAKLEHVTEAMAAQGILNSHALLINFVSASILAISKIVYRDALSPSRSDRLASHENWSEAGVLCKLSSSSGLALPSRNLPSRAPYSLPSH
jgi:hypothetical protein